MSAAAVITRKALSRRTLLRGAGTALALPFLDAMAPAMAATPAPVGRLGYVYMPMGAVWSYWKPTSSNLKDGLSPTLQSLAPVAGRINVFGNMELKNAYPGTHATSNAAFLSAATSKWTESTDYYLGTTADQIAAQHIGQQTKLPSLELSMDLLTTVGQCDNGYACVYQNNLSWSSPTTPLPAEAHPRIAFERLFGDGGTPDDRRAQLKRDASILDWVSSDIARLQRNLGAGDRHKVNEYLDTVREVERRIQKAESATKESPLPDLDRPVGVPASYAEHARLMFDLQVLAMQGDVTRVITFQLARETSNRSYLAETGVAEPHHPLTHNGGNAEMLAKVAKINAFHVSLFSEFLQKLAATKEGDGSLLDHSIYMYGSGMGNSDIHDHINLPVIVAGRVPGGRFIEYKEATPLANLHLTLLDKAGVQVENFADSNGKIAEL